MNAYELADELLRDNTQLTVKAAYMLRQQEEQLIKYEQVLQSIANEQVELSHDKIKWQCEDHIQWAKEILSLSGNNAQSIRDDDKTLPKGKE